MNAFSTAALAPALAAAALGLAAAPAAAGTLPDVGHGHPAGTASALPAPSGMPTASAHAGHSTSPPAPDAGHEDAAGHDEDAAGHDEGSGDGPGGARPVVLGSFAAVNAAVVVGAGVLRLRARTGRSARRGAGSGRSQ